MAWCTPVLANVVFGAFMYQWPFVIVALPLVVFVEAAIPVYGVEAVAFSRRFVIAFKGNIATSLLGVPFATLVFSAMSGMGNIQTSSIAQFGRGMLYFGSEYSSTWSIFAWLIPAFVLSVAVESLIAIASLKSAGRREVFQWVLLGNVVSYIMLAGLAYAVALHMRAL